MTRWLLVLAALTVLLGPVLQATGQPAPQSPPDRFLVVRCGVLLAVPGLDPQPNSTLVIKNRRVERVMPGLTGPDLSKEVAAGADVQELDLRDQFVLPGLIDCHVHLSMEFDSRIMARAVTETDAAAAIRSTLFARRTLEAGFTTVRDVGSSGGVVFALRDAINAGEVPGPRILAAGEPISVTGGHGDQTNGFRPDLFGVPGAPEGIADGPDECRKAVRFQIKLGADVIKLTATGGVLSNSSAGLAQHFFPDELEAIVQTAHSMNRRVAAHAHGVDGINAALRAGVDSIEHGTYLDEESVRLFKEHGAYLVPTLLAGQTVTANAEVPGYYMPMVAQKARQVGPKIMEAVRLAHTGGVKIAFGTDSGVSPHGQNGREFGLMVKAGMSPTQSIVAATVTAAELCGINSLVGSLEAGKAGDFIAVSGNPLEDVACLEQVRWVVRDGVVYKRPG